MTFYLFNVVANTSLQKGSLKKLSMVSCHWCTLKPI